MSKLFVGVEIDDNLVFEDNKESYSDAVVTVAKVLNLYTMELEDLSVKDCAGVLGFPYKDRKDSYKFRIKRSKTTDDVYKYICKLGFSAYFKDGEVAVFKDGCLLGDGGSKLSVRFCDGYYILFNLYNSTFNITYMINTLYSGFIVDTHKCGYRSVDIMASININIFEHYCAFSCVSENVYKLFDNICIVNRLIRDTIVESGTYTLFINLEESTGVCNLVVPPSVNKIEILNFRHRFSSSRNNQIMLYLPKDKVDDLAWYLVNDYRRHNTSNLSDVELLKRYNLFVIPY